MGRYPLWIHPDRNSRHSTVGLEVTSGEQLAESIEVPAAPLRDLVGDGCDLLKLDCEGAEFEIFEGTDLAALARIRRLVCEVHLQAGPLSGLRDRLEAAGLQVDRWRGTHEGLGILYAKRPEVGK